VINVGLNKTGTTSLEVALRALGYASVFNDSPKIFKKMTRWFKNKNVRSILNRMENCDNMGDHPFPWIVDEILNDERFSDDLLIATTRANFDEWFDSLCWHAKRKKYKGSAVVWYGLLPVPENREHFQKIFHEHYEKLEKLGIPILVIDDLDFEKLGSLIGLSGTMIPDVKFPHERRRQKKVSTSCEAVDEDGD